MMKFEVERARDWFRQGLPLVAKVDRELAVDLDLFSRGGLEILHAIEKQNYAVLGNRPAISKTRKLALVARAAMAKLFGRPETIPMSAGTQQVPIPWTPAPPQLVMAYSVCKGITRRNAKNFYYGFLVLPRRKREALCAVYAFMRRCDDITDDPKLSPPERRQQLEAWLDALHRAQQGQPTDDAILLALTDAQRRYAIPAGLLDELAHGTAMDLDESEAPQKAYGLAVQYKTFEDLRLYCYRVASVVGLVCIHIFGYRDPAAEPLAERCGLAFQLTNIIRDVKEDAGLGRVYLPEEDLAKVRSIRLRRTFIDRSSAPSPGADARSRSRARVLLLRGRTDRVHRRR